MDRRDFVRLGVAAGAVAGVVAEAAAAAPKGVALDKLLDAGVREQGAAMAAGQLSSQQLVKRYLARIAAVDKAGPRLNSVIELNPDALTIAAELDRERAAGKLRGPLHGIPVLLKDNIATGDKMSTSAGSLALDGVRATRDAFVAERLRAAGAVIIGKTNLSEWANMRSTHSVSGWSGRGGQTRNPHALDRNTSGSSSGSGAAIAASLATLAVGTETDGSIVSPSSSCGIVGLKPTLGLVSRSGIIPIAHSQDTAGPMTRSVADAAFMLAAMTGVDKDDAVTNESQGKIADYAAALRLDGLRGKRIGVARNFFGGSTAVDEVVEKELAVLKAQGAILVEVKLPNTDKYNETEVEVLLSEFKPDLAAWLAGYAPHAPVKNMADVIAFNDKHAAREMPHFGQEHLIAAQDKEGLEGKAYREALANNRRYSREEGIDKIMREEKLDALVAPTGGLAWLTDYINGDHYGMSFSSPAAVAGYPHITVPAGFAHGLPVGISFVGGAYSEATLIGMAYAYEQASKRRRAPAFPGSVNIKA
ncbi:MULTISPECIES: amidase [unclassified Massilia]|uniref:amidase n=1 Tax=unclassified Massilia TaxID=2609279 RepID=UPI00177FE83C|nr:MULTISPECIES: amidase [unclassified Massilia]MBD8530461.1 amidase [Massilia sp. CFBP 13647]MBD8674241.1 amidase [Massilia sp. CFBP 13721]